MEGRPLDEEVPCLEELQRAACSPEPCGDGAISYARDPSGTLWQLSSSCYLSGWTEVPAGEVPTDWPSCDEATEQYPVSFSCDVDAHDFALPAKPENFVLDAACVFLSESLGGSAEGVGISLALSEDAGGWQERIGIIRGDLSLGPVQTQYSGSMTLLPESTQVSDEVFLSLGSCLGNGTRYTPDPCTLEILELVRGDVTSVQDGDAEKTVELGSRVRMSVVCPEEGLYSKGADDYGPSLRAFSPHEFVVEVTDCEVD